MQDYIGRNLGAIWPDVPSKDRADEQTLLEVRNAAFAILKKTPGPLIPRTLLFYKDIHQTSHWLDAGFDALFDLKKLEQKDWLQAIAIALDVYELVAARRGPPASSTPKEKTLFIKAQPFTNIAERYVHMKRAWLAIKQLTEVNPTLKDIDREALKQLCKRILDSCHQGIGSIVIRRDWIPAARKIDHWMDWDDGAGPIPIYKDVPAHWASLRFREWLLTKRFKYLGRKVGKIAFRYTPAVKVRAEEGAVVGVTRVDVVVRPDADAIARQAAAAKLREAVRRRFG